MSKLGFAYISMTSAQALNNAVLPYALSIAKKGWQKALADDPNLRNGLNVFKGKITHEGVAESLNLPMNDPLGAIAA